MKKILFVATVTQHFYYFHLPYFKLFREMGWRVDVASSGEMDLPFCDNRYEISIKRSPFDAENLKAYGQLKKLIKKNKYDIIHCHTPMGGLLARCAASKERKRGAKVIYTAHGFHFYKGAPPLNWMVYFPIEFLMSKKTDCLITINNEDHLCAEKYFGAEKVEKVNGVGYNSDRFFVCSHEEKLAARKKLGYSEDEKLLIYVAEMNANKNQSMLIEMMKKLLKTDVRARLLIVGSDNYDGKYIKLAKELNVENRVDFLGHREDIEVLLHACDVAVASSIREGLPVNVMEALACGLPVVLSDNRGHRELVSEGENGFLVSVNDSGKMAEKVAEILSDSELYSRLSSGAAELVKPYSKENVGEEMKKIYLKFIV